MKLAEWLAKNGIKRREFGRRIGVAPPTITGYCDGSITPSLRVALRIAKATDKKVMPHDFEPPREAAE